jgi:glutaredoxin 3
MPSIEIYTSLWCPYCAAAKRLLDRKGVAYREIEAPSGSPARSEAIERSGGRTTVPQIFVDGRAIGGYDDLVALDRTGELDRLLGRTGTAASA